MEEFNMTRDEALESMIEVTLPNEDSFNIVRETLERIGVSSRNEPVLYQSVHILHKQGRYYLAHFKELFALDGKPTTFSREDKRRRNRIAVLLEDWDLLDIEESEKVKDQADMNKIKIIKKDEKEDYDLVPKYQIGNKGRNSVE